MAFKKSIDELSFQVDCSQELEFCQQLDQDFPFEGIDEEQLRRQTQQWMTCVSEILGPLPSRMPKEIKR